jgi:hypothetical protein
MALVSVELSALTACGPPEINTFTSPDGRLVAKIIDYRGGGPTVSADEKVEIYPQDGLLFRCKAVFEGENMGGRAISSGLFGPMSISWRDARTLTISYCYGSVGTTVPAARANDVDIAIELVKETHGDWPSTIPSERRMGPGPCL